MSTTTTHCALSIDSPVRQFAHEWSEDALARVTFLFQSDPVCPVEKATVRQACMLATSAPDVRLASLDQVRRACVVPCLSVIPVGTVEFVLSWCDLAGVRPPGAIDFPEPLRAFLGRDVRLVDPAAGSAPPAGWWIKPVQTKAWEARRVGIGAQSSALPRGPFWATEHVELRAEWRVYVLGGEILGAGRYDDGEGDDALPVDLERLSGEMIRAWGDAPAAYALDVALDARGRGLLVEASDAWALGYYRGSCSPRDYARMLAARWAEVASASQLTGIRARFV